MGMGGTWFVLELEKTGLRLDSRFWLDYDLSGSLSRSRLLTYDDKWMLRWQFVEGRPILKRGLKSDGWIACGPTLVESGFVGKSFNRRNSRGDY